MRKFFLGCFFLCLFSTFPFQEIFAEQDLTPQSPVAEEKLFYKISLNETCYIQPKEATINARVSVKILQGTLDKISLEVFGIGNGQGEIYGVNGEFVKDWSLRRENSRTFLEIRHNAPADKKTIELTISGRQPVPVRATMPLSPVLFCGVDSASFLGFVQFRAAENLRLHAKQERGLIPISGRSSRNFAYSILTNPSLRIEVSNANDLLAPVALEDFSLVGNVGESSTRFHLRAKASVRELNAEVAILTGNAALVDFSEKNNFLVLAKKDEKSGLPEYRLKFPSRGKFDVDLEFDAGIDDANGWRHMKFAVPVAQVAPYSLNGMPADTIFAAGNVSIPQPDANGGFSGFLPANGEFDLRWSPSVPTPPEFSACVYSLDTISEIQISTGALKQKNELEFGISQGSLSEIALEIFGEGEILSVEGLDVVSWERTNAAGTQGTLRVRLSQPKTGKYKLRVISQTRNATFPNTLHPLRLVPEQENPNEENNGGREAICVRIGEFLRLRDGVGMRCEAVPQTGMTQILPNAFPQTDGFFDTSDPAHGVSVYRLSSGTENLQIKTDFIRTDLIVSPHPRWFFGDGKISLFEEINFEVRDAPLYELHILIPADLAFVSLDSDTISNHEISDAPNEPAFRLLKIVFSEPLIGSAKLALTLQKNVPNDAQTMPISLQACRFPQAHFVFEDIAIFGEKNLRVIPVSSKNLTEIPPEEYLEKTEKKITPKLAFRVRGESWELAVSEEKRLPELRGKSVCVYKISEEKIFGNFTVDCETNGVPVAKIQLGFPKNAKILSITGENIREWKSDKNGVASVEFASNPGEKFSVSASFEEVSTGPVQAFEGVSLLGASGESGLILITADEMLNVAESVPAGSENATGTQKNALATIPTNSVEPSLFNRCGEILFRAYQFVERPFQLSLKTKIPTPTKMPPLIITEARIAATPGKNCDVLYRYRTAGATELRIEVPENVRVFAAGAKKIDGGTWSIPLSPESDEIAFQMASEDDAIRFARERHIVLPKVFAPVVGTIFTGTGTAESSTMAVVSDGRRLNFLPSTSMFQRLCKKILAGNGLALAISLALPFVFAAGTFFARKKIVRKACRVAAPATGTLFSVFVAWCVTSAIIPDYGETILMAGMTNAGAPLDITLRQFYFFDGHSSLTVATCVLTTIFVIGVGALIFGTISTSPSRVKICAAGRIVAYVSFMPFAFEDFPYRIPALIAVIFIVEISAIFAVLAKKIFVKLGEKYRGNGGLSRRVAGLFIAMILLHGTISSAPEMRAENAAEENVFSDFFEYADPEETPHDIADRIVQSIDVRDDRIVVRGDIRVSGIAGDRFTLLSAPAVLTSFERRNGAMLRLERNKSGDQEIYQIVLERAGTFTADFSYELALSENARGFQIFTGEAAADVATVRLHRTDVRISASNAVTVSSATFVENGHAGQIAQVVFKPKSGKRTAEWNPRERDRSREQLKMFATGENLYVPTASVIEGKHVLKFVPAQGEISSVKIQIPESFSVSKIEGPAIHRWNFNRKTGTLTVLFTAPRVSEFSLSIFTQAQLKALPAKRKFSALFVIGCVEQIHTIGLATDNSLQVDAIRANDLVSIDEEEFSESLSASGLKMDENLHLRRAFRTIDEKANFDVELAAVRPDLRIDCTENFFVNGDSFRAKIDFSASVSRAELFKISFKIPAGTEVDTISGDELSYWTKTEEAGGGTLVTLHLKNALEGEKSFRVRLSGAIPQNAEQWQLPSFIVQNAKIQRGEISVSVDKGLQLRLATTESSPLEESSSDGRTNLFKFRYFNRVGTSPKFVVLESKPFTSATWLHRVFSAGRYAFSRVDLIFNIENVMQKNIDVRLPANALAVRFSGENIVSAEKISTNDTGTLWRLNFPKPIRGEVDAVAEFFTPLPTAFLASVPAVSIESANRQNAWLAVAQGNVFAELKSHSPEKVSAQDVPAPLQIFLNEKTANAGNSARWFVEKFAEKYPAEISISKEAIAEWTSSERDLHQRSFSAKEIKRNTVFDKNDVLTEERIVLNVSRSDVLRVALPAGGTLRTATVNGVPAKVFFEPDANARENIWIPIRVDTPNQTVRLTLVYSHSLNAILRENRDVFEILPAFVVPAEKISWSLRPIDVSAKILEIFGRDPEKICTDATMPAEFLEAYFPKNLDNTADTDFSQQLADSATCRARVFEIDGNDARKPSAIVATQKKSPKK